MVIYSGLSQLLDRWQHSRQQPEAARQALATEILHELLLLHEERGGARSGLTAEQICRDCPELLADYRRLRESLERVDDLLGRPASAGFEDGGPVRPAFRPSMVPSFAPLQRLGNYELLSLVGTGGMSAVYKARHVQHGQIVALKVMPPRFTRNPVLRQRFEQEFLASRKINHPNVIRALDYSSGEMPFLVMEFVDGQSLGDKIAAQGPLAEPEAIRLMTQVCMGLHRAHQLGLIHRDIKPHNILLGRDGMARLADLGLVKDCNAELGLNRPGMGFGTLHFMAPEQHLDANRVDFRCDIYSLGATLYMMVTGEPPFGRHGSPVSVLEQKRREHLLLPRRLVPDLTVNLEQTVLRAMRADPDERPASCLEFLADLMGSWDPFPAAPEATPGSRPEHKRQVVLVNP